MHKTLAESIKLKKCKTSLCGQISGIPKITQNSYWPHPTLPPGAQHFTDI